MTQWIDVKDELPELNTPALLRGAWGCRMLMAMRCDEERPVFWCLMLAGQRLGNISSVNVTEWMPIPGDSK
jgi:hypothetical protein